jgi:hypothetical protein
MTRTPCVIGVSEHTGWAHLVCVAAPNGIPTVVARRRVTLIDRALPTQPYEHDTRAMTVADAEALIERVQRSVAACTAAALDRVVTELAPDRHAVAIAIRQPPFPGIPKSVAAVHASHRLVCSADGMLYQLAICHAAETRGLDVRLYRRGEETALAADTLGVTPEEVEEFVGRTGRPAGPPWTQEHRRTYAASIATLARHMRGRLTLGTVAT